MMNDTKLIDFCAEIGRDRIGLENLVSQIDTTVAEIEA